MKKFAIFPVLCGSDSMLPLDGRWSYETIRQKVIEQASKLRKHSSWPIIRAQIHVGDRLFTSHVQYEVLWQESDLN